MFDLLGFDFFQNALLATVLIGIVCGYIGTYIVARRSVFVTGGITHASFGGLGLAYFLGISPFLGASLFALFAAFILRFFTNRGKLKEDSLIGIMWSVGMAIGVLFIYLTPGYAPNLLSFLFGNILTITSTSLTWAGLLTVAVLFFFHRFSAPLYYVAFDRDFALSQRTPFSLVEYGVTALIALSIVLCMKLAGIVLVISYMTIPPAIASLFYPNYKTQTRCAVVVSVIGSVLGLFISAAFNIPSGATIVVVLLLMLPVATLLKRILCRRR